MTGHRCRHPTLEIGETVVFRVAIDKSERHQADSGWTEGVCLGGCSRSTQFLIGTKEGLFKTAHQNVKRVTKENAFQVKNLVDIKVTVDDYIPKGASTHQPGTSGTGVAGGEVGGRDMPGDKTYQPRSFRISKKDGVKYNFTEQCPGYVWLQTGLGPRRNHIDACRRRFTEAMAADDDGKDRVDRAYHRQTEWMAKEVEENDKNDDELKTWPDHKSEQRDDGRDAGMSSGDELEDRVIEGTETNEEESSRKASRGKLVHKESSPRKKKTDKRKADQEDETRAERKAKAQDRKGFVQESNVGSQESQDVGDGTGATDQGHSHHADAGSSS